GPVTDRALEQIIFRAAHGVEQSLAPYPGPQQVAMLPSVVRMLLTTFLEVPAVAGAVRNRAMQRYCREPSLGSYPRFAVNLREIQPSDRPDLTPNAPSEQVLEGRHHRQSIPCEDPRVFACIKSHGQPQKGLVVLMTHDRLKYAVPRFRAAGPGVALAERYRPARGPGGHRGGPRLSSEVTNLHRPSIPDQCPPSRLPTEWDQRPTGSSSGRWAAHG